MVQRGSFPAGDINGHSTKGRYGHGKKIRLNHILNIGEISRLLSIPKDDRWATLKQCINELWDDRRVNGVWILLWTKNIEIPQGNGLETVELVKKSAILLADIFL